MKAVSLISGGIDSPVASYLMSRAGADVVLLHMDNRPYADDRALRNVMDISKRLDEVLGKSLPLYVAPHGDSQKAISETYATIHVSKISPGYTDDVSKELRKGDYIRARVTGVKPSLQLTTKDDHLGAIRSLCSKCKTELVKKGDGLYCPECKQSSSRKLADDYGDVRID